LIAGCTNRPYRPGETAKETYFGAFSTPPTKLDPATAYYSHEGAIIDQIYEPPFTYHYLKRPYTVIPQTAAQMPEVAYFDTGGERILNEDPPAESVGKVVYTIRIRPGILYQDHPCFAKDPAGKPAYAQVTEELIRNFESPSDFPLQGTRELTARDYALQIRRMADPRLACPIFSTLATSIEGYRELGEAYQRMLEEERARRKEAAGAAYMQEENERENPIEFDYMSPECPGIQVVDDYTFTLALVRKYPQILYWMCMHFFAPVPAEAIDFYNQAPTIARQFSLNRWPVGTGAYYLEEFNPNYIIVLQANPNYHPDTYPSEGDPDDEAKGLLTDAGKRIPFIQRQELRYEKESIPYWNKFLQGYYDASGIANDVFDQAIQMDAGGDPTLSDSMEGKGIKLLTDIDTSFWYTMFNMNDEVVGGLQPERRKLRQAISIALDYNEYLDIFANGRGILAQGPIPPGIFGYREGSKGVNPYVNVWDHARGRSERKPIEEARRLLEEAGYPGGRTQDGNQLTLYYDHAGMASPVFRSYFDWQRRRLKLLGIEIRERGTELSRYRQKLDNGNWQTASGGWLADYPDPENFLFLYYGPNGKVKFQGPNSENYSNPEYDELFRKMESMSNTPERAEIIDRMLEILRRDCPAVWQYYPVDYTLQHTWLRNVKPHQMSYNTIRFRRIDPTARALAQTQWNPPVYWPVLLLLGLLVAGSVPAAIIVYRRDRK
jgi:ABC-type transport system substrate-binding protein